MKTWAWGPLAAAVLIAGCGGGSGDGLDKFGGIPENAIDNRRQSFVELHGLF